MSIHGGGLAGSAAVAGAAEAAPVSVPIPFSPSLRGVASIFSV
jgi:catalase (peroxidase I)